MFPVYTGINRSSPLSPSLYNRVPCIHRDKPAFLSEAQLQGKVFPVYTGINRILRGTTYGSRGVPCIHRDKPATHLVCIIIN